MKLSMNIDNIERYYRTKATKALKVVSNQLATYVQDKIRANRSFITRNLLNSIQASEPEDLTARVSTNVVYAARVEFGFVGEDSLGRYYNQAPKSYMRSALLEKKDRLFNLFALLMRRL